jgi:hypothetical protein
MGYSIFASKKVDSAKTSKNLERFEVQREDPGIFEAAMVELYQQGYKVHGVIGKEGFDESGRPSRKQTPRQ